MSDTNNITAPQACFDFLDLFRHVLRRRMVACALSMLFFLSVSACTTIDTKSFDAFNAAVDDIIAIDTVLKPHIETVKYREMGVIAEDLRKIDKLALEFDSDDVFGYRYKYSHQNDEPLFLKLQRFDDGLIELNSAFEKYAYLLATLAGDELISEDEFRELGRDLNSNLRSASARLGSDVPASGLALFSTIASKTAFEAIQKNRKAVLIQILDDNQQTMDAVIAHAQQAIQIMRDEIVAEYGFTRNALIDSYPGADSAQQVHFADRFLAASEQTAAALEMLKAVSGTYTALAAAHRQLSIGLKTGRLPSFGSLKDAIENVWKRYRDIKSVNDDMMSTLVPPATGTFS